MIPVLCYKAIKKKLLQFLLKGKSLAGNALLLCEGQVKETNPFLVVPSASERFFKLEKVHFFDSHPVKFCKQKKNPSQRPSRAEI